MPPNVRLYAGLGCIVLLIGTNVILGMAYRSSYSYALGDADVLYVIPCWRLFFFMFRPSSHKNTDTICTNTIVQPNSACAMQDDEYGGCCIHITTRDIPCKECTCQRCCKVACTDCKACSSNASSPPHTTDGTHVDTSTFVIDIFIPHFIPKDRDIERTIRTKPSQYVMLHVFDVSESNDTICYSCPKTMRLKCAPRLHPTQQVYDLTATWQHKTLQISYDYMVMFKMYEATSTFTAIMEDDCEFCEQAWYNGRVHMILQFMNDNGARDVIAGPGACGHVFWSSDIVQLSNYFELQIVNLPRDTNTLYTVSGDEMMKSWGSAHGGGYMTKYTMVYHLDGRGIAWNDDVTRERNRHLSRCGEIQSFVPPRYDTDNCWDVMFSPCHGYNKSKYAEDIGYNPYRIDVKSANYMLGSMVTSRLKYQGRHLIPYTFLDHRDHSPSSMVVVTLANNNTIIMTGQGQDCNSACRDVNKTCAQTIDARLMNDCSFLNAVFNYRPPIPCRIPFTEHGPFMHNVMLHLSAFAATRHASNGCFLPNFEFYPISECSYVCTCV